MKIICHTLGPGITCCPLHLPSLSNPKSSKRRRVAVFNLDLSPIKHIRETKLSVHTIKDKLNSDILVIGEVSGIVQHLLLSFWEGITLCHWKYILRTSLRLFYSGVTTRLHDLVAICFFPTIFVVVVRIFLLCSVTAAMVTVIRIHIYCQK